MAFVALAVAGRAVAAAKTARFLSAGRVGAQDTEADRLLWVTRDTSPAAAHRELTRLMELQQADLGMLNGDGVLMGLDEAGRGAWAGPVMVGAAIWNDPRLLVAGVKDSKKLSESAREVLFDELMDLSKQGQPPVCCKYAMKDAQEVDQMGLDPSLRAAMIDAVELHDQSPDVILADFVSFDLDTVFPDARVHKVKKGDQIHFAIAAASILAKVARDRWMRAADKTYPGYGFAVHKGYGTKNHIEALERYGPCPIHRRSFKPVAKYF